MEAAFLTPLRSEQIGAKRWLLTDDLVYRSASLHGIFVCTHGFSTDYASIPRAFYSIFPPVDNYDRAAVLHDCAYGHALQDELGDRVELVKFWADRVFYEAMRASGVPLWQAWAMFKAVDLFGNPATHPLAANQVGA
jgi:hypothetical protein